ncbi:MAG: DUF5658 family protein [Gammaproteobacteria bacterium]|jgi:hypothetical protein
MRQQSEENYDQVYKQRGVDRRSPSLATLHGALFKYRRRGSRRDGEHINSYVDWYGHWTLLATFTVIVLCCADAFLTIILLSNGAAEMNVLMDWLIQKDIRSFAVVKMSITGLALVVLVLHLNFRVYKVIAVRYLIFALVPMYSLLIAHELHMLSQLH